jgi:hypothetical protein
MVTAGSVTMTSNTASAEELTEVLAPSEEKPEKPKVRMDRGVPVEEEEAKEGLSKAASELGKKGGKAAAKARKEERREAREEQPEDEPEPEGDQPDEDEGEQEARKLEEEVEAEPGKRFARAKERIAEKAREARRERLRADALEAEVQRLKSAPPAPQAAPQTSQEAVQPQGKAKPREEDYETYGEFVEDLADWKAEEKLAAHQKTQEREQYAHAYAGNVMRGIETFRNKVGKAVRADESLVNSIMPFEDVVKNSSLAKHPDAPLTQFMVVNDEIMGSDEPARLMAYLNDNEEVMEQLLSLRTPDAIVRKMERIQASLEGVTAGTPPTRRVSQAPPPVPPVTGTPRTAARELDDSAPLSAHVRAFGERELKARSR